MKNRIYGIDLCRILGMLGILTLHLLSHGGVLTSLNETQIGYWTAWGLHSFSYISINIFALMTGYLCAGKNSYESNRIIELLSSYFFYMVCATIIFSIFMPESINGLSGIITSLFPVLVGRSWYIVCYVALFFLIPYVNLMLKNLDDKTLIRLCLLLFILFSVISGAGVRDFFVVKDGYSVIWLLVLYIGGAMIKRINIVIKHKVIYILMCFMFFIAVRVATYLLTGTGRSIWLNYNSPIVVIMSVLSFIALTNFQINNEKIKSGTTTLANYAFDVYILHTQILIYDILIKGNFKWIPKFNGILLPVLVILSAIAIYLVCSIIGALRNVIFNLNPIKNIIVWISNKVDSVWLKNTIFERK